jgi:hypothetical protein
MPASHFDVNSMTGRPKFIVRHSTFRPVASRHSIMSKKFQSVKLIKPKFYRLHLIFRANERGYLGNKIEIKPVFK